MEKILSICSGGIDSVSMTSKYKNKVITLMTFDYGQRGIKEIDVVKKFGRYIKADVIIKDVSNLKDIFGKNQLCGDVDIASDYNKTVVVPLRNALFLQIAMIYAYTNKFDKIILGSHLDDIVEKNDERLYPDCSPEFFKTFELAMDFGTFKSNGRVEIVSASILGLHKKDLIRIGYENLGDFIFGTWSCYKTQEKHCGICESCQNRKRCFDEVGIMDKTGYID